MNGNVNNQSMSFDEIFKDVYVQAKMRTRRVVALVVVICLVFGLIGFVCGRASAYSQPGTLTVSDFVNLNTYSQIRSYYADFVSDSFELGCTYTCCVIAYDSNSRVNRYIFASSDMDFVCVDSHSCWHFQNGAQVRFCTSNSYANSTSHALPDTKSYIAGSGSGEYVHDGTPYFSINPDSIVYSSVWSVLSQGQVYCNWEMYYGSSNLEVNLVGAPDPHPDQRTLSASKVYLTDNYYLQVEAYPTRASDFGYVTLTYYDTLGTFTKTLGRSDGIRVSESGEDAVNSFVTLTINPNLVSQYKFTVTSVEYVSSGDFGDKSVSELDLIFNEDPFPMPSGWDSISSYSTYNTYSSIGVVGGGIATFDIGYLNNDPSLLSWRESSGKVHQPFRLNWIALPDFLWDYGFFQFANFNIEELYQLFETYDVVILGVGMATFNDLYPDHVDPAGVKDNYDFVKSGWMSFGVDYAISIIDGFESPYRSCNRSDSDDPFTVTRSSQCGFIWTRSFLLKQVSWYCGDTSERLLELESRLVDENDGALTSIQEKLNYLYEDNNGFINDCLHSLSDISYALNNLDVGALGDISLKLDRIIDYLDFDIDIDVTKLARPWSDIFLFAKKMFDDSAPMWDSISSSASILYDGLPVSNQYDVESLPDISGPIPLFPTIAPVPVIPTLSPTPVPIGSGG